MKPIEITEVSVTPLTSRNSKTVLSLGLLSVIIVAFQNCSFAVAPDFNLGALKLNGNGTGYDGKPYGSYGDCGGTIGLMSKMMIMDDKKIYLVHDECRDLDQPIPVDSASMSVSFHNQDVFVYAGKIFDPMTSSAGDVHITRTICWTSSAPTTETGVYADAETFKMNDTTSQLRGYLTNSDASIDLTYSPIEETKMTDGSVSFVAGRLAGGGDTNNDNTGSGNYSLAVNSTGTGLLAPTTTRSIPGYFDPSEAPTVFGCFVQPIPATPMLLVSGP